MRILICDAEILNENSNYHLQKINILIENGTISYIGKRKKDADKVITGDDLKISPGWFDMFANFGDPGYEMKEDLESGSRTAVAGGFTGVALIPNTNPVIQTKNDISYLVAGNDRRITQVYPIGAITTNNLGEDMAEMIDLHHAGAIAFSDGLQPIRQTDIMLKSLQYLQKFNGLLINKPEDERLNLFGTMHEGKTSTELGMKGMPRLAEELMVSRDLQLLKYVGGRIHFSNVSTPGSLEMIRKAKKDGLRVTCDVAAHQFVLEDTLLSDFDTNYKVNPPLREKSDSNAIIKGLQDDTIDVIVSSHQPQDEESKNLEFDLSDFGIIGLQTVLPFMGVIANKVGWPSLINKVTTNPRKILNLERITIAKGARANITVFDSQRLWKFDSDTNMSKSKNSPMLGKELQGKIIAVFNNNRYSLFDRQ